jgi:hypothetical protein
MICNDNAHEKCKMIKTINLNIGQNANLLWIKDKRFTNFQKDYQ